MILKPTDAAHHNNPFPVVWPTFIFAVHSLMSQQSCLIIDFSAYYMNRLFYLTIALSAQAYSFHLSMLLYFHSSIHSFSSVLKLNYLLSLVAVVYAMIKNNCWQPSLFPTYSCSTILQLLFEVVRLNDFFHC